MTSGEGRAPQKKLKRPYTRHSKSNCWQPAYKERACLVNNRFRIIHAQSSPRQKQGQRRVCVHNPPLWLITKKVSSCMHMRLEPFWWHQHLTPGATGAKRTRWSLTAFQDQNEAPSPGVLSATSRGEKSFTWPGVSQCKVFLPHWREVQFLGLFWSGDRRRRKSMVKVNVPEFSRNANVESKNTGTVSETASLCILLQRGARRSPGPPRHIICSV